MLSKDHNLSHINDPNKFWLKLIPPQILSKISNYNGLLAAINNSGWLIFDKLIRLALEFIVSAWIARYLGPNEAGTEYKLYIAGPIDDEICIFNDILSTYPDNFEYLGFLSVNTEEFCEVVEHIPFCILPSCSEAMATSIVTLASNFGTIPLITKECGFDFDNEIIEINSLTIQSVKQALFKASLLTEDEIYIRISSIKRKYSSYHSNESFYSKFEYSLKEILR